MDAEEETRTRQEGGEQPERDIPRPNELQPTPGILLKMRGRGLPEGWPRPPKVAPFFKRLARPALSSNLATPSRTGRPAWLPGSHTAADRSLLLSRRLRDPWEPRGWSSQLPSSYPRYRPPDIGTRCFDARTHTHMHVHSGGSPCGATLLDSRRFSYALFLLEILNYIFSVYFD